MGSKNKRVVLALDPGRVRIGVAVSDELGLLAHPRPFVPAEPRKDALAAIARLASEIGASRILLGMPLELGGSAGVAARKATVLAQAVADATGLDVELADERLTTTEASWRRREAGTKGARGIDSAAAAVLLQAWLDRANGSGKNAGASSSAGLEPVPKASKGK